MRKFIIPLCFIVLVGCRDESQINDGTPSITGYRIEGLVVDSLDNGIYGVVVRLAYTYLFVDSVPPQSTVLTAPHAGTAEIRIYDWYGDEIREIADGYIQAGSFEIPWDHYDDERRHAGSGLYFYSFALDGEVLAEYPILIDSAAITVTDESGNFSIGDVHFPIGAVVPRYSAAGEFLGNFMIFNRVQLLFSRFQSTTVREVTVSRGRLVTVKQILQ